MIERKIALGIVNCFGGGGGGGYSPPPVPAVQPAPATPSSTGNDPEVEAAMNKERMLARKRKGRQSTILSPLTDVEAAARGTQKTLLGE